MKKRSNITLIILAILLLSIPVVGIIALRNAINDPKGIQLDEHIRIMQTNKAKSDSSKVKVSVGADSDKGITININK
jgi:flagellar basal body-associated protein FliL